MKSTFLAILLLLLIATPAFAVGGETWNGGWKTVTCP
jgi:hypothetical protein